MPRTDRLPPDDARLATERDAARLMEAVDELRRLEAERKEHAFGSPRFLELSRAVERQSRRVFEAAASQEAHSRGEILPGDAPAAKPEGDQTPIEASTEAASDLRWTSDTLLINLDRLIELESAKRTLDPASVPFRELAREIEDLAHHVAIHADREETLGAELSEDKRAGDTFGILPIDEVPVRPTSVVLEEWREAERTLAAAPPGSDEANAARADADRLRREYQAAAEAARAGKLAHHRADRQSPPR